MTTVRLARPASLVLQEGLANSPNVDVSASGRMGGFLITARHRPNPKVVPTLIAMQASLCPGARCKPAASEYVTMLHDAFPWRQVEGSTIQVTLPPGDYEVRAITDRAPVRMTLRLAGLRGTATIPVTRPRPAVMRTDASTGGVAGIDPLRNVGVTHTFNGEVGFLMHVIIREYEPHVRNTRGICYYRDGAKPPTGRYHPGCPNAESEDIAYTGAPMLDYYETTVGSLFFFGPGEWTLGHYVNGVGGKSSLTVHSVWLDLI